MTVKGAFQPEVILPAAQAVPDLADSCLKLGGGPVLEPLIGDDAAQVLEFLILIFRRSLEPVSAVQIHDYAALVKADLPLRYRSYSEGEVFLIGFYLKYWGTVIPEVIVSPLPEIRMRRCRYLNCFICDDIVFRLPCPVPHVLCYSHCSSLLSSFSLISRTVSVGSGSW